MTHYERETRCVEHLDPGILRTAERVPVAQASACTRSLFATMTQASHPCFQEPNWLREDRTPTQGEWDATQEAIVQAKRISHNQRLAIPPWVTRCSDLGTCTEIHGSTVNQRPWSVVEVAQQVRIGSLLALADNEDPARAAIADHSPAALATSSPPVAPSRPPPPTPLQTHGWERWHDGEGHYWWSHEPSRRFFFEDACPNWMQWKLVNESTGDYTRWWARYDDEWHVVEYFCES